MNPVILISIVLGALLLIMLVVGIVWAIASGFFGEDPRGRDPGLFGQFKLWGTGPEYVEFLRNKRKLLRRTRKKY